MDAYLIPNLNISISRNIIMQLGTTLGASSGYVTSTTCQNMMGNKCPAACGNSWEQPIGGVWTNVPAVTVTCKGTCFTDF